MSKLIGMMIVRNESDRYLTKVLEQMKTICDDIYILDDFSTDNTVEICKQYTNNVYINEISGWEVSEITVRKKLWKIVTSNISTGDWILALDADEIFKDSELHKIKERIKSAEECGADGISFPLYDMWNETHYRSDKLWSAHEREWLMLAKYNSNKTYIWNEQGLHCGRLPLNIATHWFKTIIPLLHYGWAKEEDRLKKYIRYMKLDSEGRYGNLNQYKSIIDEKPNLIEFNKTKRILIAAPCRQDKDIFELYLESLRNLEIPEGYEVDKFFILHNSEHLKDSIKEGENYAIFNTKEDYKKDEKTHYWENENFKNIVLMKNTILKFTLEHNYDYVFFVDTDLILHPKTLSTLLESGKDIIAELFNTKWDNKPGAEAMPSAWDSDSYTLLDYSKELWKKPGVYKVGGTGACILINRRVLLHGVNFSPIYNISYSFWEDRAFAIRAACAGFEEYIDTHYEPVHLYRRSEYDKYIKNKC